MAWKEQCEIAFEVAAKKYIHKGMGVREALRTLSEESGIPYGTLYRWFYREKNSVSNNEYAKGLCIKCGERPGQTWTDPKTGRTIKRELCSSCANQIQKENQIKHLKMIGGQVKSITIKIQKESNSKFRGKITKGQYESFVNVLRDTIKIWEGVS